MQQPKQMPEGNQDDDLLAWFLNLWTKVETNYTKILMGFGIGIAVVLVLIFINRYQTQRAEAAQEALGDVYIALFEGRVSDAIATSQEVMASYQGEAAAREALMAVANLHFEEGRVADARTHFQKYLDENSVDGPLGYGAWSGLASCLESEGNFAEAAQQFASFSERKPESPFAPVALKEAGRCYELAQMQQQASDVYLKIVNQYSESSVARTARGQLSFMGVEVD